MKEQDIKFTIEKETKNTVRYKEVKVDNSFIIGTLYVQKSYLGDNAPKEITVTIKIEE